MRHSYTSLCPFSNTSSDPFSTHPRPFTLQGQIRPPMLHCRARDQRVHCTNGKEDFSISNFNLMCFTYSFFYVTVYHNRLRSYHTSAMTSSIFFLTNITSSTYSFITNNRRHRVLTHDLSWHLMGSGMSCPWKLCAAWASVISTGTYVLHTYTYTHTYTST